MTPVKHVNVLRTSLMLYYVYAPTIDRVEREILKTVKHSSGVFCSQPLTQQLKENLGLIPKSALENASAASNIAIAYIKNVYQILEIINN